MPKPKTIDEIYTELKQKYEEVDHKLRIFMEWVVAPRLRKCVTHTDVNRVMNDYLGKNNRLPDAWSLCFALTHDRIMSV